ncbi:hypothetical protein CDAR_276491 [Caerostris darwini]|uniref:Endonuclease/exonuclease/phosphatase domain-containing protein n=1 Tax=Caerostris darwini TaxID=1538125 RepID=A0AAV4N025_9ARAC|nr:hypothetical protein CDAR_276491 [Caerostris darwini]
MANRFFSAHLKGGHLNLGNARAAMASLNNAIVQHDFDFSLNEPYSYDNSITNIPLNYTIVAHHTAPKAAIIKSKYNSQIIFTNQDLIIIMAHLRNRDFLLVTIYCSPSKDIDQCLDVLGDFLFKFDHLRTFILGDFNAKSRFWGQRNLDCRARKLLVFCDIHELNIENQPDSLPTFSSSRGDSWIDLILTKNLNSEIDLEVLDEITNSDYNLLVFLGSIANYSQLNQRKISLGKLKWLDTKIAISKIMKDNIDIDKLSAGEINKLISNLQENIFESLCSKFKHSNKPTTENRKRKNTIWWTRELEIKRSRTRALRRLFQKDRNQQSRQKTPANYKKSLAEYKKLILFTKKTKFKEFINSITTSNIFGNNFNIFTNKKKKRSLISKPIKNSVGSSSVNLTESTNILDFDFPWSNAASSTISISNSQDFIPLSCNEVEATVLNIKPKKAVGSDGLPGEIIQEIFHSNKSFYSSTQ